MLCRAVPGAGELVVECNTPEVRQATVCPKYGPLAVHVPAPAGGSGALPLVLGSAKCSRSALCSKPAGHSGFCSGPKAGAGGGGKRCAARSPRCAAPLLAARAAPAEPGESSGDEAATVLGGLSGGSSPSASAVAAAAAAGHGAGSGGGSSAAALRGGRWRQAASSADRWAGEGGSTHQLGLPPGLHTVAEIGPGLQLAKVRRRRVRGGTLWRCPLAWSLVWAAAVQEQQRRAAACVHDSLPCLGRSWVKPQQDTARGQPTLPCTLPPLQSLALPAPATHSVARTSSTAKSNFHTGRAPRLAAPAAPPLLVCVYSLFLSMDQPHTDHVCTLCAGVDGV